MFGDFWQISPIIEGRPCAQIVFVFLETSSLYRRFQNLQLTEKMRGRGCKMVQTPTWMHFHFLIFFVIGEEHVSNDRENSVKLLPSIAIEWDGHGFC